MRFIAEFSVSVNTGHGSHWGKRKLVIAAGSMASAEDAARVIAEEKSTFVTHSPSGRVTETAWRFGSLTEMRRRLNNQKINKV